MLYPFSHGATQFAINLLMFTPLKFLPKILVRAYDFAVNIVMLINITKNKTHNVHDSVKKLFMQLALLILL